MFHEINFSPYATNVIDCRGREDLCTIDGLDVDIKLTVGSGFTIVVGNHKHDNLNNLSASYLLNSLQVGYYDKDDDKTVLPMWSK